MPPHPAGAYDYHYDQAGARPLPDSPPSQVRREWRRRGEYHRKGTSQIITGEDHKEDMGEDQEGAETAEQRVAWIEGQMAILHDENFKLQHDLEAAKKKAPVGQGRPPRPGPQTDCYSVPCPPDFDGLPPFGLVRTWNAD